MKRLAFLLIVGLCVFQSNAQTTIIKIPRKCIEPQGTINLESSSISDSTSFICDLERIFKRRTNERIWQLTEFLSYLRNKNKGKDDKIFYINSTCKLFANGTNVEIRNDGFNTNYGLRDFLMEISFKQQDLEISLDSIEIPKWDHALIESDTLGVVYSTCEMTAIHTVNKTFDSQSMLPLVKDQTEDGVEWVPLFGNMIVSIKINEDDKKDNRHSLSTVNDKLR